MYKGGKHPVAEKIKDIASRFLLHLSSIERLLAQNLNNIEGPSESDLGEFVEYVLHLKAEIKTAERDSNSEEIIRLKNLLDEIKDSDIYPMVDKHTHVELVDDGRVALNITSTLLRNAYLTYSDNKVEENYDLTQYNNSLVVSLVIGLEILISNLFKDYINNYDVTNQIIKEKTLTFTDLKNFESVDDARVFLQDQFIDNLLRSSFDGWLNELEGKLKINLRKEKFISDDINLIIETLQRRHLIIHNDGIVNDFYIKKVSPELREDVQKGEELNLDKNYIESRIKVIRKFGLVLIYHYVEKIYKNNLYDFFQVFNNILLSLVSKDCDGVKYFYKKFSESNMEHGAKLVCTINYFLAHKLVGDNTINSEIEKFEINALSIEYRMAKSILLEKDDANDLAIQFLKPLNDNVFMNALEWPLMRLLNYNSSSKRYIKRRINTIIKKEMNSNDE